MCIQGKKKKNTKYSRWKVQNINNRPYFVCHLEVAEYVQLALYEFVNAGRNLGPRWWPYWCVVIRRLSYQPPYIHPCSPLGARARESIKCLLFLASSSAIPNILTVRRPLHEARILLLRTNEQWIIRHEGSTLSGKCRNRIWRPGPRLQIRGSFFSELDESEEIDEKGRCTDVKQISCGTYRSFY